MNSRITLAIFVTFGMVMMFLTTPLQQQIQQNAFAQDDESDTDTEQRLRQKNLGSGESTNFNCAENLITSASDSIECLPSGPAPPTPPPIPTEAFTIDGTASGTFDCEEVAPQPSTINIAATGEEGGTVTGAVTFVTGLFLGTIGVNGGTTDGNTFSLSGPNGLCVGAFTLTGGCGTGVVVNYEDSGASGTYNGNVECTLA